MERNVPDLPVLPFPHQRCLDWNRDILKKELGLSEQDIIDLPALFKIHDDGQAIAYFPNMVRPSEPQISSRPSEDSGKLDTEGLLSEAIPVQNPSGRNETPWET